jgi:hypothetical protein
MATSLRVSCCGFSCLEHCQGHSLRAIVYQKKCDTIVKADASSLARALNDMSDKEVAFWFIKWLTAEMYNMDQQPKQFVESGRGLLLGDTRTAATCP